MRAALEAGAARFVSVIWAWRLHVGARSGRIGGSAETATTDHISDDLSSAIQAKVRHAARAV